MITKDVKSYISMHYSSDLEKISVLSKSSLGKVLVDDERELYNFDEITKKVYKNKKVPSSADSLLISEKRLALIEYKAGFKKIITKKNFDYNKICCPDDTEKKCFEYADLLFKKQRLETNELLDSLKLKAIESYITLEKKILPLCNPRMNKVHISYCVIIDDYIDSMQDTLNELAEETTESNSITQIKTALSRLVSIKDANDEPVYYDEIIVFSPYEFIKFLDKYLAS